MSFSLVALNETESHLEELLNITMTDLSTILKRKSSQVSMNFSLRTIQVDNMLKPAEYVGVTMFVGKFPEIKSKQESDVDQPPKKTAPVLEADNAVNIQAVTFPGDTSLFEKLLISIEKTYIQVEERLLLKLLNFSKFRYLSGSTANAEIKDAKRYYFDVLTFNMKEIKLTLLASTNLSEPLKKMKQEKSFMKMLSAGLVEDLSIQINAFTRLNVFEDISYLQDDIKTHFRDQLIGQSIMLLGSVDIFGNPVGLLSDVKEGIRDLVLKRDLQSFASNFLHGVSNSTGKIAHTIGNISSAASFDADHNSKRSSIRALGRNSGDHISSGFHSLIHGLQGIPLSVINNTRRGAQQNGILGAFTGAASGVAGTVTKPVAGIFDFAAELSLSLRDKLNSGKKIGNRVKAVRLSRVTTSMNRALQNVDFMESICSLIFDNDRNNESNTNDEDEFFYLGRLWEFYALRENKKVHHFYMTSKRLVFFILKDDRSQVSYTFHYKYMKSCVLRKDACVISYNDQGQTEEFVFSSKDMKNCVQLVRLTDKARSLWYETTHYIIS